MAYNYILTSDDVQAAAEKIEEIEKSIPLDFERLEYDLEEEGLYAVVDEITTVSLFDQPKFVIVKSAEQMINCSSGAVNALFKAMNDLNSENVLVFLFLKSFDSNQELFQKLKKYASVIELRMTNIPLDEYIEKSLKEEGYTMDKQAISLLVSYQPDLSSLRNDLEQLKCYKKEEKVITDTDIKQLIAPPLEDNIYQLVDAVLNKDKKRMFSCFRDLKLRSVQASYLVTLLINKFQELYNVSILTKGNLSQAELANLFNVSSGRAYYMMKNAKSSTLTAIVKNLDLLNQLEYDIKTGKIEQNLGLELYFLN